MKQPDVPGGLEQAERVLESLFDVRLAKVLSLVGYLREPDDFAAITGSVAVGLGNAKSDVDIMVVGREHEQSAALPLTNFVDGVRVDVWKLDRARLDQLAARARRTIEERQPVGPAFGQSDIRILQRLAFGLIIDGVPTRSLTGDAAKASVCALCTHYFAELARQAALASHLAASADDCFGAAWNARHCLDAACESRLAREGKPFIGAKWLYHRVRTFSTRWWDEIARHTVLPDDFAPGKSAPYAEECIALAEQYLAESLRYDTLAAELVWVGHALQLQDLGDKHMLLDIKQYRIIELSPDERSWWQETFGSENGHRRTRSVADTPEGLAMATALWRNSLVEVRQASQEATAC